jgi:hypothetical protein
VSIEKAQLKMAVAHDIGVKLDDRREAAEAELHRFEGAVGAMKQAGENIEGLIVLLQKDVDGGAFDGLASEPIGEPLKLKEHIVRWLRRALGVTISLREVAETNRLKCAGKLEAMEAAVKDVRGVFDEERAKAAALTSEGGPRPAGRRPGPSIAQLRKAGATGATQAQRSGHPQGEGLAPGTKVKPAQKATAPRSKANGAADEDA